MAAARTTHQKRNERQRKRRSGFHRRPNRNLNVQKKRRASAQRADAAIKVEEIPQEDGGFLLVEDDGQPLDYVIDDYLDDPSKTIYVLIPYYIDTHQADFAELAKHLTVAAGEDEAEDGDSESESDSD